jgi:hypothetical protein
MRMKSIGSSRASPRRARYFWLAACPVVAGVTTMLIVILPAGAAVAPVGLGTAGSFAVLAGTTVTNTGVSQIHGDLGVSPGTAVTGFPPGIVSDGSVYTAAGAAGAQADLTIAYNDAAGRTPPAAVSAFIGAGQTISPGVYKAVTSLDVGGALTLNAHDNPNAVFIFQVPSTLITDSASTVILSNGAQACNVFWQVGSSATLGTGSTFTGTILALQSITVTTGDTILGRALARNGAVTLDTDTITVPACASPTPPPTTTTTTPPPSPTGPPTTGAPTTGAPTTGAPTTPPPRPTATPSTTSPSGHPSPTSTFTTPAPKPTGPPKPKPKPKPKTRPKTAPVPKPVGTTFPVTG